MQPAITSLVEFRLATAGASTQTFGRNFEMNPLLNSAWTYTDETLEENQVRYSGFGCGLYDMMRVQLPSEFRALKFYRANDYQTEDSFAVCETEHPFCIQLDPDCEVICLWDSDTHVEIGTWSSDPCQEAVEFILKQFKKQAEHVVGGNGG